MAIAMKMKIEKLEIMPLGFSATFSGECINETKLILKNIAIALAGPLLTLIFIIIFLNISITIHTNAASAAAERSLHGSRYSFLH